MVLHTQRLLLRPVAPLDAPRIQELAGQACVARMTAAIPHPYTLGDAEEWVERVERAGDGAIFAALVDDAMIGCIGYSPGDDGVAEFGFWIGRPFWGRGYATEAGFAVIDHAFETTDLRALGAGHFEDNWVSRRVLQKLGFVQKRWVMRESVARGGLVRCLTYRLSRGDVYVDPA